MVQSTRRLLLVVLLLIAGAAQGLAAMTVSLSPSVASPAPLGTLVLWTPTVSGLQSANLWYRYRAKSPDKDFQMVRDFGPNNSLRWIVSDHEGIYQIEVAVRNLDTGDSATTTASYALISRITGNAPVISSTINPMVFLYSAPPCPVGSSMRVQFQPASNPEHITRTPTKLCQSGLSMNFFLAGMPANATYQVQHEIKTGFSSEYGPILTKTIPSLALSVPSYIVLQPSSSPSLDGIILHSPLSLGPVATDLSGTPIWYYPPGLISYLTRPKPGGFFLGLFEDVAATESKQIIREFDLAWSLIRETNAARVSEQLVALGKRPITAFHHEVSSLPDGSILMLASTEQILTDVQGAGPVDVIGDMIIVLDPNLQVSWAWDAFNHLDPYRSATLGDKCSDIGAGCAPYHLAKQANDWLHGNSLQLTPDGNILYSCRNQDWIIKINYSNGSGNGDILWRLGKDGDFAIISSEPLPWFSHQHDARFELGDNTTLTVFDNGNTRHANDDGTHSRGQIYRLNETNHTAELLFSAWMGGYSSSLGSAQKLHNGNYHFNIGSLPDRTARSMEFDISGLIVYSLQSNDPEYRTFRMIDLYSPYDSNVQPETRLTPERLRTRIGDNTSSGGQ
jgi:arylsulfate sulfotransferase